MADVDLQGSEIPPLMHFPLAKALSVNSYNYGKGRLFIRRDIWDGVVVNPATSSAYPVHWLYYEGGVWFVMEAASGSTKPTIRVAEAADMGEEDFLAWDWTTLAPGCVETNTRCGTDGKGEFIDLYKHFLPYDKREEVYNPSISVDLNHPNVSDCGNSCYGGDMPPGIVAVQEPSGDNPIETDEEGNVIPRQRPWSGGGGNFIGDEGVAPKEPRKPNFKPISNAYISIQNVSKAGIPSCVPRLDDGTGSLCLAHDNPDSYTMVGFNAVISGSGTWFIKTYFAGELMATGSVAAGATFSTTILKTYELRPNAQHGITVSAWKPGHRTITAHDAVTMSPLCAAPSSCGATGGGS